MGDVRHVVMRAQRRRSRRQRGIDAFVASDRHRGRLRDYRLGPRPLNLDRANGRQGLLANAPASLGNEVAVAHDADDAGERACRAIVQRRDSSTGHRRMEDMAAEHARQADVGDETRSASQNLERFQPERHILWDGRNSTARGVRWNLAGERLIDHQILVRDRAPVGRRDAPDAGLEIGNRATEVRTRSFEEQPARVDGGRAQAFAIDRRRHAPERAHIPWDAIGLAELDAHAVEWDVQLRRDHPREASADTLTVFDLA